MSNVLVETFDEGQLGEVPDGYPQCLEGVLVQINLATQNPGPRATPSLRAFALQLWELCAAFFFAAGRPANFILTMRSEDITKEDVCRAFLPYMRDDGSDVGSTRSHSTSLSTSSSHSNRQFGFERGSRSRRSASPPAPLVHGSTSRNMTIHEVAQERRGQRSRRAEEVHGTGSRYDAGPDDSRGEGCSVENQRRDTSGEYEEGDEGSGEEDLARGGSGAEDAGGEHEGSRVDESVLDDGNVASQGLDLASDPGAGNGSEIDNVNSVAQARYSGDARDMGLRVTGKGKRKPRQPIASDDEQFED